MQHKLVCFFISLFGAYIYLWLNAQIWRRIQRITYHPGVPIKYRNFLRNFWNLCRSRSSSYAGHYLQSIPIVPQPKAKIRSRLLVALGAPDRFMNPVVEHGFVNNVFSKNLWAMLRQSRTPNSSAVCDHRGRAVRPIVIGTVWCGERGALRTAWCLSRDARRASNERVSNLKGYNVGTCGRTLLCRGRVWSIT